MPQAALDRSPLPENRALRRGSFDRAGRLPAEDVAGGPQADNRAGQEESEAIFGEGRHLPPTVAKGSRGVRLKGGVCESAARLLRGE